MATTSFIDAVTQSSAAWGQDVDTATYSSLTGVAGTNTITAGGPKSFSLAVGQRFVFIPAATNTGATTLNITPSGGVATGAKNVFCGGAACVGGEIFISIPCLVVYDGTQFNILGPYVGGLVASGQVKFPATQNASSNANTLDDYEEGTWTPAIAFGGGSVGVTYTTQEGDYQKIGRQVTAHFRIVLSNKGSSNGAVLILGLPFAAANASLLVPASLFFVNLATTFVNVIATAVGGQTQLSVFGTSAAAISVSNLLATDIANTTDLAGTVVYHV